ncbi:hypothetical protein [Desulfosporosinus nitroreducens]|nr:hypothetical protein [Desulfosporosinus nitroreducens]
MYVSIVLQDLSMCFQMDFLLVALAYARVDRGRKQLEQAAKAN